MLSTYYANGILNKLFNNIAFTMPTVHYLGLSLDGVEPTALDYSRVQITSGAIVAKELAFSSIPPFPTTESAWGQVNSWHVYDSLSGGNSIFSGGLSAIFDITIGKIATLNSSTVKLTLPSIVSPTGIPLEFATTILEFILGLTDLAYSPLYIGFSTYSNDENDRSIAGEASGGGYARELIGACTVLDGAVTSNSQIDFTTSGDWTSGLDNIFIANHLTDSSMVYIFAFSGMDSISPVSGKDVFVPINGVSLSL